MEYFKMYEIKKGNNKALPGGSFLGSRKWLRLYFSIKSKFLMDSENPTNIAK
ncbi:MAG: hypothetical protein AAFZ15_21090 [Bacteroidota bacterium]